MLSPNASVVATSVSTVIPGSRNAAISEVIDWGALKKVLLWGSSNISVGVEKVKNRAAGVPSHAVWRVLHRFREPPRTG